MRLYVSLSIKQIICNTRVGCYYEEVYWSWFSLWII